MIETLRQVLEASLDRLRLQVATYLPSLLAGIILLAGFWATAILVRWLLYRIFKGPSIDLFLRRSGLAYMIDKSGRLRATRLVAETAYWGLLLTGLLLALSVFNTNLTTQMIEQFLFLMPKLVIAAFILLGGAWLSQFLGRSALVWAVNEDLPAPRRLAMAVRVLIMFVAVVVAADQLNFARSVFLAAFIIAAGSAALAAGLAVGLGASSGVRRYLEDRTERAETSGRSLWNHL
jgi:hypothetical protein